MTNFPYEYEGAENLDIMSFAPSYNQSIFDWVARGIASGDRVLEFGAGKGEFCNRFKGKEIVAVEIDARFHQLITCEKHADLDTVTGVFDLIYSINVLEHLENDAETVKKLRNLLSPKGRLKLLVPAREEIYTCMDEKIGHLRRYRPEQVETLLTAAGLRIIDMRYFDFVGYFLALVFKLINKDSVLNPGSVRLYDRFLFPVSRLVDRLTGGKLIGKNIIAEAVKS